MFYYFQVDENIFLFSFPPPWFILLLHDDGMDCWQAQNKISKFSHVQTNCGNMEISPPITAARFSIVSRKSIHIVAVALHTIKGSSEEVIYIKYCVAWKATRDSFTSLSKAAPRGMQQQ